MSELLGDGAQLSDPTHRRVPAGFDPAGPAARFAVRDGFHLVRSYPHPAELTAAALVGWCADRLAPFGPVHRLCDSTGGTCTTWTRPRSRSWPAPCPRGVRTAEMPDLDVHGPVQAEVFLLCLEGSRVALTGPCGPDPWYLQISAEDDPLAVVTAAVDRVLGRPRVVHSTSWRRDRDAVVLSFVAVVDAALVTRLAREPMARSDLARGTATTAPARIAAAQVVEHGLRHLAWLVRDDPGVAAALPDEWLHMLDRYVPEPFRHARLLHRRAPSRAWAGR